MPYKTSLEKRITAHQSRLSELKLRQGYEEWQIDSSLSVEIQHIEGEISRLRGQLRQLASPLLHRSNRLYQKLLRLYPGQFRQAFGPEMAQVFYCQCDEAFLEKGGLGLLRVWLVTLLLLPKSLWVEYRAVWAEFRPRTLLADPVFTADELNSLFINLPHFLYNLLLYFLDFALPGGPLTILVLSFFVGGMLGVLFNSFVAGLMFALLFIPSLLSLVLLCGLMAALAYALFLWLRQLWPR